MRTVLRPLPLALAVAEKAIREFSNQWLAGLQPQLSLETGPDGQILVNSRVAAGDVPTRALVVRHHDAEALGRRQAGEAVQRPRPRRHGPSYQRRLTRRAAAREAAATADEAVQTLVETVEQAGEAVQLGPPTQVAEEAAQSPTQPSQVAAGEVVPPVLQPSHHHDQNSRSAPPDAAARCAPPGSLSPPHPPRSKKHTYMEKEKQRWTSLFET